MKNTYDAIFFPTASLGTVTKAMEWVPDTYSALISALMVEIILPTSRRIPGMYSVPKLAKAKT